MPDQKEALIKGIEGEGEEEEENLDKPESGGGGSETPGGSGFDVLGLGTKPRIQELEQPSFSCHFLIHKQQQTKK